MNRRAVLKLAGAGAAAFVLPGARSWRRDLLERSTDPGELGRVLKRAREAGKPLLLLVILRDDEGKPVRGLLFGGLLQAGGDGVLADLALCEVACAEMDGIRSLLGKGSPSGEPMAILVKTDAKELRALAIDPDLPPHTNFHPGEEGSDKGELLQAMSQVEQRARDRIARLGAALHAAIAPDRTAIAALAAAAGVGLSPAQARELVDMAQGRAAIGAVLADRGAAILRLLAEDDPSRRKRILGVLCMVAVTRLQGRAPTGAKWARDEGCGTYVEGETGGSGNCGMGFVPEVSRRFLCFFTDR